MLEKQLEELGLSDKEAKVYIATLEIGQGSASEISKKSGVNRATTYFTLENLMKAGLVSASSEEKKQLFSPEDPAQLENIITKKQQDLENQKKGLKGLVDELSSINSAGIKKPIVKYYLGKEGIMSMVDESLKTSSKTISMAYPVDAVNEIFSQEEKDKWRKKRLNRKIKTKVLYTYKEGSLESSSDGTRKRISHEKFPLSCDIAIYDNKVRIASLKSPLIGIIIENKEVADSLRSIWNLAWKASDESKE